MSKVRGTINLPNTPVGGIFTDNGSFSSTFLLSTSQYVLKYSDSIYCTTVINSSGTVSSTITGGGTQKFLFNDPVEVNTTGSIVLGDVQSAGNDIKITINDFGQTISIHNSAGPIEIGDTDSLGNNLIFTVRDDQQRFVFSNNDDATPFGIEFPDGGGGGMIGTGNSELIGFWGATPTIRSLGWSADNYTTQKTFDPTTDDVGTLMNYVCTLVDQLKTYGILG